MGDKCTLTVNGKQLRVSLGDTLVDAGLAARMLIPHDCCSGQCDTCLVRVVSGDVDPQGSDDGDLVRACQATIEGDAEILFDEVPVLRSARARSPPCAGCRTRSSRWWCG